MSVQQTEPELHALMVAGLAGDASAYRDLLEKLSRLLRGYYKGQFDRIGRGQAEAEDLTQETLIAIHTRRDTYDPLQLFTPWVYAIARYKFVDYLRRAHESLKDLPIEDVKEITSRDDREQTESSLDLEKLMADLPPRMREAIQAVKLGGLSVSEAAVRSGMSESNVKVSVHRGLKAMAKLIGRKS